METEQKEVVTKEGSIPEVAEAVRRVLPAPGKPLTFEEALERSATENKELLQRLAQ
jgi:hypothetical protein